MGVFCHRWLQTAVAIDSLGGGGIGACDVEAIRDEPLTGGFFPAVSSLLLGITQADEQLLFVADCCCNLAELEGSCKLAASRGLCPSSALSMNGGEATAQVEA